MAQTQTTPVHLAATLHAASAAAGEEAAPMYDTLVMIMAGGRGERLYPLTRDRAKPAVPFGGRYRIIDFALSNFINSGFMRIKVLTQYLSYSLLVHLSRGYNFGSQSESYVDPVPAEQGIGEGGWYVGTAHAIFMNLNLISDENPRHVAIFGGDHIYKMDIRQMHNFHRKRKAACTVACLPYDRKAAAGQFGILEVDENWRIVGFEEKPADPKPIPGNPELALGSMGNYFFNPKVLRDVLHRDNADPHSQHDFGRNVIPDMIGDYPVYAYNFLENIVPGEEEEGKGYWRDVGTIESYYDASMDLRAVSPKLNLYNFEWPIRSTVLQYPPAKFVFDDDGRRGMAVDSLVAAGSVISGGMVRNSIVFANNFIHSHSEVNDSILFHGCNIGRGARLRKVIADKNVTVEDGAVIGEDAEQDAQRFHLSASGLVVIPKNTIVTREGPLRQARSAPPPGSLRPRIHPPGGVQISPEVDD
jgi:glucose-1-phosphate adenylyltransferase